MEQTIFKEIKEAVKYWWLFLLTGFILMAVGDLGFFFTCCGLIIPKHSIWSK